MSAPAVAARPSLPLAPVEPLRPSPDGRYDDGVVVVEAWSARARRPWPGRCDQLVSARCRADGRIEVVHRVAAAVLDDEIGPVLAAALEPVTDEHEIFARAFTGLVLTTHPDPGAAWLGFYRRTLALLELPDAPGYSAVYRHALDLLPASSVLDVGASLGFLSLHLAARGTRVTACDVDEGTTRLLAATAARLGCAVDARLVLPADGRAPALTEFADASVDAVALLHVLEHVDAASAASLLAAAQRIARHRIVIAVPYEDVPTRLFGHVRTLSAEDLHHLGVTSGWSYRMHDHLGGWLVLDRPDAVARGHLTTRSYPVEGERK